MFSAIISSERTGSSSTIAMLHSFGKSPGFVEHISHAAGHAGCEVTAGLAQHHDDAAGHVFAAVIAGAFDDGHGTRVTHGETLAGDAAEVAFALDRAIHHGVADDDRLFRHDGGVSRWADDDLAAERPLPT